MKTFEQFRAWMKDYQAWNEFLNEYYNSFNETSPAEKYKKNPEWILAASFTWKTSYKGYEFWSSLQNEWLKFNNVMQYYQLVYINKRIACVKMPKQATAVQIGFVESALQKENPEITDFDWENGNLYGCVKVMELEKI